MSSLWVVALLVRGAGGSVKPFLGEGIFYTHRTGELAALAVDRALTEGGGAADQYSTSSWSGFWPIQS